MVSAQAVTVLYKVLSTELTVSRCQKPMPYMLYSYISMNITYTQQTDTEYAFVHTAHVMQLCLCKQLAIGQILPTRHCTM